MPDRLSHEDYVRDIRRKAADICAGILAGEVDLFVGCHSLASLRQDLEVDPKDPDFAVFDLVSSETDALPVGEVRSHWAPEALAQLQPQIEAFVRWASPQVLPACSSVVERFGPNISLKRTNRSLRD
jgi:hypothetical protein